MQNYDNLISKALKSYKEKNFQQALYYYNLFKKQNKNLENLVDFNINYVNKLIKNNKFIYIKKNNIIKPDISIIVPVYNASKYLQQCLESIINQTFKNLEIICIDDGSTDNSIEILKKYADIDNRITIISQENKYAGYARNVGIGISKGEYLLFLDSDDFFDKKLCEKLYKKAITNDNDIVICNTFFYDDKTSSIKEPIWSLKEELLPSKEIFSSLEVNNCIFNFTNNWPWNKLIKKELIEKNKIKFQEIKHTNDTYFICMCLALSKKISIVKERLIYYRINSGKSLTTSSIRDLYQDEVFKCLDEIFNKLKFYNLLESFKYSFYTLCTQQLFWNYNILSNKQYRINFINKIINRNFYDLNLDEFKFFLKKQHDHDTIEKIENIFSYFTIEQKLYFKIINNKYEIISFDIFDTLITRLYYYPQDLFTELEYIYKIDNFEKKRILAEKEARKNSNLSEILIEDIYKYLPNDIKYIKEKEIEKENEIILKNENMIELLNKLINNKYKVILTSDMYLSETVIKKILRTNNIYGYEKIYLSSTKNLTKKEGDLFKKIIEDEKVEPNKILHIGDNINSDVTIPQNLGISTFYYTDLIPDKSYNLLKSHKNNIDDYLILSIIKKICALEKLRLDSDYWSYIGCSLVGPLILYFYSIIFNEINIQKPDCIFFIARDGYLLKKVFHYFNINNVPSYYIYASRGLYRNIKSGELSIDNYLKYLEHEVDNLKKYKKILLIDTTTINFTAQNLLEEVLPNTKISGVYWLANSGNKKHEYNYCYCRPHRIEKINFLIESLLSAPTPPVNSIKNFSPVFEKANKLEELRCNIYKKIVYGTSYFCKTIQKNSSFKNFKIKINNKLIENLLFNFINNLQYNDIQNLSKLSHSGDEFNKENVSILKYLNKFKNFNSFIPFENKIQISLIICVYNGEKYLEQCLNSICKQTLLNIEIICVDDCSTDKSYAILDSFKKKDNRIKIIKNQTNLGLATSRNKAIKIAAGEYLQFVDADDYILENCCEELYKRCISLNLDMMTFSGYNFSSQNNKIENPYWNFNYIPKNWKRTWFTYKDCIDFLPEIHVSSCLTIYRRSLLLKNKILFPDGLCFEDNLFFTKAIFYAKRYSIHKGKFYARRIHSNAITQNWDKHFLDYIKVATLVINFLNEIKIQKQIIKNYKEKYISVINWCVKKYGSYLEKKYSKEINTFYNQE